MLQLFVDTPLGLWYYGVKLVVITSEIMPLRNRLFPKKGSTGSSFWGMGLVSKAFWMVMLIGHAPALGAALSRLVQDSSSGYLWFKFIYILASSIYFALKLAGFRLLKHNPSWRHVLVYCLVVALLHTGVVLERGFLAPFDGNQLAQVMGHFFLVVSSAALVFVLRRRAIGRSMNDTEISPRLAWSFADVRSCIPLSRVDVHSSHLRRGPPSFLP